MTKTKTFKTTARQREYAKLYRRAHRKECLEYARKERERIKERMAADPEYAERIRAAQRVRDRRCYRKKTAESRKRKLEYNRKYYHTHKDQFREKRRQYRQTEKCKAWQKKYHHDYYQREEVKERYRQNNRAWRAANPDKVKASRGKWQAKRQKRYKERIANDPAFAAHEKKRKRDYYKNVTSVRRKHDAAYRSKVHEAERKRDAKKREKRILVFSVDAEAYAKQRATERTYKAIRRIKKGLPYTPRYHLRIPDEQTFRANAVDSRSQFLLENRTLSQRAQVFDWVLERRKKMQK